MTGNKSISPIINISACSREINNVDNVIERIEKLESNIIEKIINFENKVLNNDTNNDTNETCDKSKKVLDIPLIKHFLPRDANNQDVDNRIAELLLLGLQKALGSKYITQEIANNFIEKYENQNINIKDNEFTLLLSAWFTIGEILDFDGGARLFLGLDFIVKNLFGLIIDSDGPNNKLTMINFIRLFLYLQTDIIFEYYPDVDIFFRKVRIKINSMRSEEIPDTVFDDIKLKSTNNAMMFFHLLQIENDILQIIEIDEVPSNSVFKKLDIELSDIINNETDSEGFKLDEKRFSLELILKKSNINFININDENKIDLSTPENMYFLDSEKIFSFQIADEEVIPLTIEGFLEALNVSPTKMQKSADILNFITIKDEFDAKISATLITNLIKGLNNSTNGNFIKQIDDVPTNLNIETGLYDSEDSEKTAIVEILNKFIIDSFTIQAPIINDIDSKQINERLDLIADRLKRLFISNNISSKSNQYSANTNNFIEMIRKSLLNTNDPLDIISIHRAIYDITNIASGMNTNYQFKLESRFLENGMLLLKPLLLNIESPRNPSTRHNFVATFMKKITTTLNNSCSCSSGV